MSSKNSHNRWPWKRKREKKGSDQAFSDFGLHILSPKDRDTPGIVDIIAIHGLNGNYRTTWTDEETDTNWLCDPKATTNARVMSFSYNSAVQFSKSVSDVHDFADELLEGILAERSSEREQQRPLIFICHSLGGIVFKQALVRAYENQRYLDLVPNIKGVFFFGTPHRGSDMAKWASMLGAILKTGSMSISTNTGLSKDLIPGSRVLGNISKSFTQRSSRLRIFSFYETQKMDFMNDVVVDQGSAILGCENEVTIPVNGNHRTICRFSSPDEARYQPVITNLVRLIKEVLAENNQGTAEETDAITSMMKSIAIPDLKLHKDRNPSPLPGTCTWLFEHPLYDNWLNSDDSSLLWITADPGCGKSVIASHLINTQMGFPQNEKIDLCYFFFKTDYRDQRSAVLAIQGLLHQLWNDYPDLKRVAAKALKGRSTARIKDIWEVFVQLALERRTTDDVSAQCTFCILDGLDECDVGDRRILANLISETFGGSSSTNPNTTILDTARNMTSIKMLILSRPDNAIKVAVDKPMPLNEYGDTEKYRAAMIRLRGEDEAKAISADVGRVIDAKVKAMIEQGLPRNLLEDVKVQLVKRADRTFLWVALILPLLARKVESGVSRRELYAILENRDIDKLYAELLSMSPEVEKARKALKILLAAVTPLTMAQMSIAIAIIPDHDILRSSNGPARRPGPSTIQDLKDNLHYPFETHLKHICGNFIRIIKGKVYLVHETAREFLLEKLSTLHDIPYPQILTSRSGHEETTAPVVSEIPNNMNLQVPSTHANGLWQHSFTLLESRALMLQICTTFLYMISKAVTSETFGETSQLEGFHEFLGYVSKTWFRHFGEVRKVIRSKDVSYYENLCHPQFPAFAVWTENYLGPNAFIVNSHDRSWDEVQEYLMIKTGMIDPSNDGGSLGRHRRGQSRAFNFTTGASSNPGSLNNSYFPLKVDANGFVGLDFDAPRRNII